jgi:UDP-N-acetylmuramate: L-alanyl-gamma-D-glutamyl-meso-diaminopimelate ligase
VPRNGLVVANAGDPNVMHVIDMGCWTPVERFAGTVSGDTAWYAAAPPGGDYSSFAIMQGNRRVADVQWQMLGRHNAENGLAAVLAARHAGVAIETATAALKEFGGVRRRLEVRGVVGGITVYDDFAHHPTAIDVTIDALRRRIGSSRLIAVLEPRSNTMKLGTHREAMAKSLERADRVWLYQAPNVTWDVAGSVAALGERAGVAKNLDQLVATLGETLSAGDHVLIMSNGGFGGIHKKLLERLARK